MKLNADLSKRAVIDSSTLQWVDSPVAGIRRMMLERDGAEAGRATSLVRYEPGSRFSSHAHPGGEEILVLEGIFRDEHGEYGPGTYIMNPPGSSHAPGSETGCRLFVKLCHLAPEDDRRIVVDTMQAPWHPGLVPGLWVMPLSEFGVSHTAMVRWDPGTVFNPHRHYGGEEIYVLQGGFEDEHGKYPAGTWIRSPHMSAHHPFSTQGCVILVKTGHLQ